MAPFLRTTLHALQQPHRYYTATHCRASTSSQPSATGATKPISPHFGFYKTFTRPVAKVLLLATFTYQLTYWLWVKLEKDEIKSQRQNEIDQLENQLQEAVSKSKQR